MTAFMRNSTVSWFIGMLLALMVAGLGACSSTRLTPEPTDIDEDLHRSNQAARLAFEKGRLRQAAELYQRALERAYIRDDLAAIVDAHYNIAVCLTGLQSYPEALDFLDKAKSERVRAGKKVGDDILLLEATLLYHTGNQDDAWHTTEQILSPATATAVDIQRKAHFLRGIIAAERGDTSQLRQEITAIGRPDQTGLQADREELAGRLAMAENNWNAAIAAFDNTADLRRENLDYRAMVNALALAGRSCEQAGQPLEASKHYFRAGRSAMLQGQNQKALEWLTRAAQLADQAGAGDIAQKARAYVQQFQDR